MNRRKLLICVAGLVVLADGIYLGRWLRDLNREKSSEKEIMDIIRSDTVGNDGYKMTKESYEKLRDRCSDVVGYIEFPNDFLSEPVAQSTDNDYYLYHWIDDTETTQGSVFMDCDCSKENQNITIYGHNVYYDAKARFSPLERLKDQEVFEENSQFSLWIDDEMRTYEIAYVTIYDTKQDADFDFRIKDFYTDEMYTDFIDWMNEHQLIEPLNKTYIDKTDSYVTLQTCVKWHSAERYLITAKEIDREKI